MSNKKDANKKKGNLKRSLLYITWISIVLLFLYLIFTFEWVNILIENFSFLAIMVVVAVGVIALICAIFKMSNGKWFEIFAFDTTTKSGKTLAFGIVGFLLFLFGGLLLIMADTIFNFL